VFSSTLFATVEKSAEPKNWGFVLIVIGVGAALVLYLLFRFYKELQKSEFIEQLLGLPTKQSPTRQTPAEGSFQFATEFLARRTEFWLLYAQVFVAIFFIAGVTALLLVGAIGTEAGLPTLSTVVGIVLGKTLLSAKGTPLAAQEQASQRLPSNVEAPAIKAEPDPPVVGSVLTAAPGEWSGALPISYAYSWRRKDAGGEALIAGANESTYTALAADKGASILVTVMASNSAGAAPASSAAVSIG
jgi:hypothetical protein